MTFYGSSFICDPYGRVLVQAPRDEPAVLVADLDLDQRRDWPDLFPFLRPAGPETYGSLVEPLQIGVHGGDHDRSFADGGGDSFDGPGAHVTDGEQPVD